MSLSQKCQYALRALFELATKQGQGPIRIRLIAEVQGVPPRFLELILGELRTGGYVASRRGVRGGYMLAMPPAAISVGDIIRFLDGPLSPVKQIDRRGGQNHPHYGDRAFTALWERASDSLAAVYDATSLQDLIDDEQTARDVSDYAI